MTHDKMTSLLSETICVTMEEARAALEAREWRILDAAQLLQRERARSRKAFSEQPDRRDAGWFIGGALRA